MATTYPIQAGADRIHGVKGAKPRAPKPETGNGNGVLSEEETAQFSREYLTTRNRQQAAKARSAEIDLGVKERRYVDTREVEQQVG
jgi:hypothetical protein